MTAILKTLTKSLKLSLLIFPWKKIFQIWRDRWEKTWVWIHIHIIKLVTTSPPVIICQCILLEASQNLSPDLIKGIWWGLTNLWSKRITIAAWENWRRKKSGIWARLVDCAIKWTNTCNKQISANKWRKVSWTKWWISEGNFITPANSSTLNFDLILPINNLFEFFLIFYRLFSFSKLEFL